MTSAGLPIPNQLNEGLQPAAQRPQDGAAMHDLVSQLPVMPGTVLILELLLANRAIDLHDVTQVLKNDLGASACLSMFGSDDPDARPSRICDTIGRMEMHELVDMLASRLR